MSLRRTFLAIALSVLLVCLLYMIGTYHQIPDRMATHFNIRGEPDDCSNKSSFFIWYPLLVAGLNILFLVLFPYLLRVIPHSLINMPHKEYWFATPERKEQALGRIRTVFYLIACHVNVILLMGYHVTVQENIADPFLHIPMKIFIVFVILSSLPITVVAVLLCTASPPSDA